MEQRCGKGYLYAVAALWYLEAKECSVGLFTLHLFAVDLSGEAVGIRNGNGEIAVIFNVYSAVYHISVRGLLVYHERVNVTHKAVFVDDITANVGYLILAVREIHLNAVCTIVLTCGYDIFKTSVIIVILPIRCSELVFIAVYGHPSVLSATLYIVVHIERYKHYLIVRERFGKRYLLSERLFSVNGVFSPFTLYLVALCKVDGAHLFDIR